MPPLRSRREDLPILINHFLQKANITHFKSVDTIPEPVLDALSRQSGLRFELVGSPSIPEFEKQLLAGEFDFACLIAGHYQAGLVGKIHVVAAARGKQ